MRPLRPSSQQPAPATTPVAAVVKQKACIPCRTRKVKCDKKTPCTNCTSWDLECVFPSPIRRCPRPNKKASRNSSPSLLMENNITSGAEPRARMKEISQSVNARVRKLEKALHDLTKSLEHAEPSPSGSEASEPFGITTNCNRETRRLGAIEDRIGELKGRRDRVEFFGAEPNPPTGAFVHDSRFTAQDINTNRLFPFNSFSVEVAALHPSLALSKACWKIYLENVDQLVKVLHRPSAERILQNAASSTCSLSNGQEALLFTIYFSSIISMTVEEAEACFQMSKNTASMTYRSAAEQALMRADFLTTNDLVTLQAFVLFLTFNLYVDDTKLVWALTGLARRLCCSASDFSGALSNLSPFEQEMHKRLWWQLWFLDRRAAEDQGKDTMNNSSPDTAPDPQLPLSVNDVDLVTSTATLPSPSDGWTEMSFSLIRYEIARTSRKVADDQSHIPQYEKGEMIKNCVSRIQYMHLRHCNGGEPIHWIAQHAAYVTVMEMWIQLHDQTQEAYFHFPSSSSLQTHQTTHMSRNQLLFAAIDIVDIPKRLETEPAAHRWKWLLKGYLQFHPLKFLLTELCRRLREPQEHFEVDFDGVNEHARRVASFAITRWTDENKKSKNGQVLLRLMSEAEEAWRMRRKIRIERVETQVQSSAMVGWQRPLEIPLPGKEDQLVEPQAILDVQQLGKRHPELGGVHVPFPTLEQDYAPIEQTPYTENMDVAALNSLNHNNASLPIDPGSSNDISWGVDDSFHLPAFDESVSSYFADPGDVLGEGVYSF